MSIKLRLAYVIKSFPNPNCKLIAVSKTKPLEDLKSAYDAGIRDFGENKVQEIQAKQPEMPSDTRWHMIGHLQSNKIKYIARNNDDGTRNSYWTDEIAHLLQLSM